MAKKRENLKKYKKSTNPYWQSEVKNPPKHMTQEELEEGMKLLLKAFDASLK